MKIPTGYLPQLDAISDEENEKMEARRRAAKIAKEQVQRRKKQYLFMLLGIGQLILFRILRETKARTRS